MTKLAASKLKTYLRKTLVLFKITASPGVTEPNPWKYIFNASLIS